MTGAMLASSSAKVRKYVAGGLIPQGGIVIGLALLMHQNPALAAMGDPRRIFTDAQICAGAIPLEWAAWQVLELDDVAVSTQGD